MRIRTKLVIAQLLAAAIIVFAMLALMQWSFESGFKEYIQNREADRHQRLTEGLAGLYRHYGSWRPIQDNPRLLSELRRTLDDDRDQRRPPPREGRDGPHRRGAGLNLLDADQNPILGRPPKDPALLPIELDNETVGWVAIPSHRPLFEANDLAFSASQRKAFVWISLCVVLISFLVAVPLARHFLAPIQQLAEGARRLTRGDYKIGLKPRGNDELAQLAQDFNQLAKTLEDNEQARRRWIADTSHELRTPLAVIKGEIEAMQDQVRPLTMTNIDSLHQEVGHLEKLVDDLYQLSNTDIGAMRYQMETFDLGAELEDLAERYHGLFQDQGLRLQLDLPPQPLPIQADAGRIHQLLGNLLTNALKYVSPRGKVRLALHQHDGHADIVVEDSGPGVPTEALPHLFDHLYRVEASRNRKTGGSGLGLAISKRIVEAHGGSIEAGPSDLGGLRIGIRLPMNPA